MQFHHLYYELLNEIQFHQTQTSCHFHEKYHSPLPLERHVRVEYSISPLVQVKSIGHVWRTTVQQQHTKDRNFSRWSKPRSARIIKLIYLRAIVSTKIIHQLHYNTYKLIYQTFVSDNLDLE